VGIIIVGGAYFLFVQKNEAPVAPEEHATTTPAALIDGIYMVADGSTITGQGRRPLVEGYLDTATADVTEGAVAVLNGGATGSFTIDLDTITVLSTGQGKFEDRLEGHLKSDAFFDVETYPTATFALTSLTAINDGDGSATHTVVGALTMKGITNTISFPATISDGESGALRVEGVVSIDRTLWDVRYGSDKFFDDLADGLVDDIFTISLDLTLVPTIGSGEEAGA